MRYLTRSYVEWLGLELVPLHIGRDTRMLRFGEKHRPSIVAGVMHEGLGYIREPDGLAYARFRNEP